MRKMGLPVRKEEQTYTYSDYRQWPEDERWELIDGVAYSMSSPTRSHQGIGLLISTRILAHLEGKKGDCRVYAAPLDVFFPRVREQREDDVDTVVQPDVLVVCDSDKLKPNGIWGAPDLVVEILSPSTSRKDLHEKYALYERSGVREYWVIDPVGRWLQQYVLAPAKAGLGPRFAPEVTFESTGTVTSAVLAGFSLDVAQLWQE
ncbi:MAG: Uma2 family endonuclease [Spirochaetales bacterium]